MCYFVPFKAKTVCVSPDINRFFTWWIKENNAMFLVLVDTSWPWAMFFFACIVIKTSKVDILMSQVSWRSWWGHAAASEFELFVLQNMTVFFPRILSNIIWFVNSEVFLLHDYYQGDIFSSYFVGCIFIFLFTPCLCLQSNTDCSRTSCS